MGGSRNFDRLLRHHSGALHCAHPRPMNPVVAVRKQEYRLSLAEKGTAVGAKSGQALFRVIPGDQKHGTYSVMSEMGGFRMTQKR